MRKRPSILNYYPMVITAQLAVTIGLYVGRPTHLVLNPTAWQLAWILMTSPIFLCMALCGLFLVYRAGTKSFFERNPHATSIFMGVQSLFHGTALFSGESGWQMLPTLVPSLTYVIETFWVKIPLEKLPKGDGDEEAETESDGAN